MGFINNHRRGIALVAACTFFWLIMAVNMPLRSESDHPGSIEQVAATGHQTAKKSPILPIIIGVVVVGAVAAVLILVVFKSYDLRGTWAVTYAFTGESFETIYFTFVGEKKSGTLSGGYSDTGTYTVDGKDVVWIFDWDHTFQWIGKFTGKDTMEGTISWPPDTGTWTAVRTSASAASVSTPKSWKK